MVLAGGLRFLIWLGERCGGTAGEARATKSHRRRAASARCLRQRGFAPSLLLLPRCGRGSHPHRQLSAPAFPRQKHPPLPPTFSTPPNPDRSSKHGRSPSRASHGFCRSFAVAVGAFGAEGFALLSSPVPNPISPLPHILPPKHRHPRSRYHQNLRSQRDRHHTHVHQPLLVRRI